MVKSAMWLDDFGHIRLRTNGSYRALLQYPGVKELAPGDFSIPASYAHLADSMVFNDTQITADAQRLITAHKELEKASHATDAYMEPIPDVAPGLTPLPYQRAGVAYARQQRRVIIGDEMGLGKTIQAILTIAAEQAYPALIIVPASLRLNWQREVSKWLPGRSCRLLTSPRDFLRPDPHDIYIVGYETASRHVGELTRPWKALVCDESQYIKNASAARTKTVHKLAAKLAPNALVLLLSGTAIMNRPVELVSPLQVLYNTQLTPFGYKWAFISRYCAPHQTPWVWIPPAQLIYPS